MFGSQLGGMAICHNLHNSVESPLVASVWAWMMGKARDCEKLPLV